MAIRCAGLEKRYIYIYIDRERETERVRVSESERESKESSLNLCMGRPPPGVMIPDAGYYNFDLLMMSS